MRNQLLVTSLLFGALLAVQAPPTDAQISGTAFVAETVVGVTAGVSQITTAHVGATLGIAATYTTGATLFALKNGVAPTEIVNQDVMASDPNVTDISLAACENGDWWLAADNGADIVAYRSVDDGATWTLQLTIPGEAIFDGEIGCLDNNPGIAFPFSVTSGCLVAGCVGFLISTNGGDTWPDVADALVLNDDVGTGIVSTTVATHTFGDGIGLSTVGGSWNVAFSSRDLPGGSANDALTWVVGSDGGFFFNGPYATAGGGVGCDPPEASSAPNTAQCWSRSPTSSCSGGMLDPIGVRDMNGDLWALDVSNCGSLDSIETGYPFIGAHEKFGGTIGDVCAGIGESGLEVESGVAYVVQGVSTGAAIPQLFSWGGTSTDPAPIVVPVMPQASACMFSLEMTTELLLIATDNQATGGQLTVVYADLTSLATPPEATVAVTGLLSMDVDPSGAVVIARTEAGDKVATYSAQDLALSATVDTNCAQSGGITAYLTNVAYLDCDGEMFNVDSLEIRDLALGDPNFPASDCSDAALNNFDSWELPADTDQDKFRINTFQLFSIDFDQLQFEEGGPFGNDDECRSNVALGFTTLDGYIGVLILERYASNAVGFPSGPPVIHEVRVQMDPTNDAIAYSCAFVGIHEGPPGAHFLVGDPNTSTRVYLWNRNIDAPTLTLEDSASGAFGQARGVACGNSTVNLIAKNTIIRAHDYDTGAQVWEQDATIGCAGSASGGCVAMSFDAKWGAYIDGTLVRIVNMTNGDILANLEMPSGVFRDLRMDEKGQNLWVATSTTIARYEIFQFTTITPVSSGNPFAPTPSGAPGGDGGGGEGLGNGIVRTSARNAVFLSIGTILAFGVMGWAITSSRRRRGDGDE